MISTVLDRFRVLKALSRDRCTMLASDLIQPGPDVVVKMIKRASLDTNRAAIMSYMSWVQTQAHPNLSTVIAAGFGPGYDLFWVRPHYATQARMMPPDLSIVRDLTSAVAFLHSNGRLHRRLRPSNVFFQPGAFLITDASPCNNATIGSAEDIHFNAPELLRGGEHSIEADLYSLGSTIYWLLTGHHLFEDPDLRILRTKYLNAVPRPIRSHAPDIPDSVARFVDGLVSHRPSDRRNIFLNLGTTLRRSAVSGQCTQTPYTGRTSELLAIQDHVIGTSQPLSVVSIEAAPGFGKTAFLAELQRRSHFYPTPIDFVTLRCRRHDSLSEFIRPLRELVLRRSIRSRTPISAVLGDYAFSLGEFLSDTHHLSPEVTRRQIHDIVGLISRLSTSRRLVIAIDDANDSTEDIEEFLCHVALRASDICGHLLLTSITSNSSESLANRLVERSSILNYRSICLLPLGDDSSIELFANLGIEPDSDKLHTAGGNPFFVRYLSANRANLLPDQTPEMWTQAALERLDAHSLLLVQSLAVLDTPVASELLQNYTGLTEECFRSACAIAQSCDLVSVRPVTGLRHGKLIREQIYNSISKPVRRTWHKRALTLLRTVAPEESLVTHAFKAGEVGLAIELSIAAAQKARSNGHYPQCISFYNTARTACRRMKQTLSAKDQLYLADAYNHIGRRQLARRIYDQLLQSEGENKSIVAGVWQSRAHEKWISDSERVKYYAVAMRAAGRRSDQGVRIALGMALTLSRLGRFRGALILLNQLHHNVGSAERRTAIATEGNIYMYSGQFQDAVSCLSSLPLDGADAFSIRVTINIGLCLEVLGRLKLVETTLTSAIGRADLSGHSPVQKVTLLSNLGSVRHKIGDFVIAESSFREALACIEGCKNADRTFPTDQFAFIKYDLAQLYIDMGRYGLAWQLIQGTRHTDASTTWTEISSAICGCSLWLKLGEVRRFRALRRKVVTNPLVSNSYFSAELQLLDILSSNEDLASVCDSLMGLWTVVQEMGAVYLSCQLGGLLATALAAADHPEQARRYADEALRISKKNGYKPLEAKAMLARGLAGASTREKEEWFSKSYKAATTIGMPELIAESAYRLGALMLESGRGALARDYLLKSTVTTSEMAEQLPIKYRAKYLAEPWRREARKRLQDCVQTIDFTRPSIADVEASGGELFRALYRISVAASDAADVDAFVTAVADVLENLPTTESAVVTLTRGDQTYWRAAGTGLTDELKARVTTAGETARKEARFGGKDWKIFGTAITWIPLDTQQTTGGIYLSRTAKAPPPAEREIEFVTTLGALVSSTIDRIATRPKSAPVKLANRQEATFGIVGSSRAIRDVTSQIELAAASAASTLIEGETGTGKELVARAIHMAGSRSSGPFVPVDCGAIPETLIESELFGAARGAYTGATTDRAGLFETAHKGTLFLDEIGNMPQALQVKLLRVLQEREVRRIGDNKVRSIDIRLITATNGNLTALVEAGTFRQDLFYRINVLKIALPPLRERRGDIPQLAAHFLELLNKRHKTRKHFADEAFESTAAYRFPGNIRELQNLIERAYFSESGSMISSILPETARPNDTAHERPTSEALNTWLNELTEGRRDFWTGVHDRYRRRDISRETLLALFDVGLRRTKGSYRKLASLFRMDRADYRRMMDFLRRNDCVLDFRPYRKLAAEL